MKNEIVELKIEMSGKAESNIVLYQQSVLAQLEQIKNKKLVTDEDFSSAEKVVKVCKEQEKALVDAKQKAQDQSATIKEVFAAIDNAQSIFRDTRLGLERQIKAEKVNRKQAIIDKAIKDFKEATTALLTRYHFKSIAVGIPSFLEAVKGRQSIKKMQEAIDLVLENAKKDLANTASMKYANIQLIKGRKDQFLFADIESLSDLEPDFLIQEIEKRESAHALEVERIKEQERKEAEEKRIREEQELRLAEEKKLRDEEAAKAKIEVEPTAPEIAESGGSSYSPNTTTYKEPTPAQNSYVESDNSGGFPQAQKTEAPGKKPAQTEERFRIDINGSKEINCSLDEAKSMASGLRVSLQSFGNCVSLSQI